MMTEPCRAHHPLAERRRTRLFYEILVGHEWGRDSLRYGGSPSDAHMRVCLSTPPDFLKLPANSRYN